MKTIKFMIALPALLALGCDDNNTTTTTGNDMTPVADMAKPVVDMATSPADMAMIPAMPALGDQLERMGRATINVAVTNPFDLTESKGGQDATRNAYNTDNDPTKWVANWQADIRTNLAIYDSLDTNCLNQFGADPKKTDPTRYDLLSTVLADDRIWMDTGKMSCGFYLALEAAAVGGTAATECGGRTPLIDVIDEMYSLAVAGTTDGIKNGMFVYGDGIAKDPDGIASLTAFPFLDAPIP